MSGEHHEAPADVEKNIVQARLQLEASHLGLPPPPAIVHLRAMPHGDGWLVYLWNPDGVREPLLAWMDNILEVSSVQGLPGRPRLITLVVPDLPSRWGSLFEEFGVDLLVIEPGGAVRLVLRGNREKIRQFLASLGASPEKPSLESLEPARAATRVLTDRQREALFRALLAGYYDIPRKIKLTDLAVKLGMSEGALSELLRRAERRVLTQFFDEAIPSSAAPRPWEVPRMRGTS